MQPSIVCGGLFSNAEAAIDNTSKQATSVQGHIANSFLQPPDYIGRCPHSMMTLAMVK
jgi:hypothetical protein